MKRHEPPIDAESIETRGPVTLLELCRACDIDADYVIEFVEVGLIEPDRGGRPSEWVFAPHALARLQRAVRLRRDLSVDPAGAALALDLIEEVHQLRQRIRWLEGGPVD